MRYISIILMLAFFVAPAALFGQNSQYSIQQATTEVLGSGILQHDLKAESVFHDDFYGADTTLNRFLGLNKWAIHKDSLLATITFPDSAFGQLYGTTKSAENELISVQWPVNQWQLRPGEPLEVEWNVKIDTSKQSDIMIGMANTVAAPADSMFDADVTDGMFFYQQDGDSLWYAVTCSTAATYRDSSVTAAHLLSYNDSTAAYSDGFHKYKIVWDGRSRVRFYYDNRLMATMTTRIPINRGISPVFALNSGAAQQRKFWLDAVVIKHKR